MVDQPLWQQCLYRLESELTPQQLNTWIRPLHAIEDDGSIRLLAPNRFVLEWVNERLIDQITSILSQIGEGQAPRVSLEIGSLIPPSPPCV